LGFDFDEPVVTADPSRPRYKKRDIFKVRVVEDSPYSRAFAKFYTSRGAIKNNHKGVPMNKKVIRVIAIVLAALMALSVFAVLVNILAR